MDDFFDSFINSFVKKSKNFNNKNYANFVLSSKCSSENFCVAIPFDFSNKDIPVSWNSMHFHSVNVIIFILCGEGSHIVDDNECVIANNRVFFLNPNQMHTLRGVKFLKGVGIAFSDGFFSLLQPMLADHIKYEILNRNGNCMYCDIEESKIPEFIPLLKEMVTETHQDKLYGHYSIMASFLTEFLMKTERYGQWSQDVRRNINSTSYKTYLDFLSLVEANFRKKKEIVWYAAELGISTALLARYVKMYDSAPNHPQTPLKILNNRIYREAESLLKHTNLTVNQISDDLGFKDCSNFVKFFKKMDSHKRTPLQCRNLWSISCCRTSL